MYIFITEDGTPYQGKVVSDHDKQACDDGLLTIIDADTMKEYCVRYPTSGFWESLGVWDE